MICVTGVFWYVWQVCLMYDKCAMNFVTGVLWYVWQVCYDLYITSMLWLMWQVFCDLCDRCFVICATVSCDLFDSCAVICVTGVLWFVWQACYDLCDSCVVICVTGVLLFVWQVCCALCNSCVMCCATDVLCDRCAIWLQQQTSNRVSKTSKYHTWWKAIVGGIWRRRQRHGKRSVLWLWCSCYRLPMWSLLSLNV